ncbi:MAG: hypothetical protein SGI74_13410 [Oligoflexia bacterium]|nr:hypothetical protein [Oligoflexia bacterium]
MEKCLFVLAILTFLQSPNALGESETQTQTWFIISAPQSAPTWKLQAIKETTLTYLSDIKSIHILENTAQASCNGQTECILNTAESQSVSLVIFGELISNKLLLKSYASQNHALIQETEIPLGQNLSLEEFHHKLSQFTKSFSQIPNKPNKNQNQPWPLIFFLIGVSAAAIVIKSISLIIDKIYPLFKQRGRIALVTLGLAVGILLVSGLVTSIKKSIGYHPIYLKRISHLKSAIEIQRNQRRTHGTSKY